MRFYVEFKSKGRCGCSAYSYRFTDAYQTKKAVRDVAKKKAFDRTVKVFTEEEASEYMKAKAYVL